MKKILFPLLGSNKGGNILSTISIYKNIDQRNFRTSILLITSENKNNLIYKILKKKNIKNIDVIKIKLKKNYELNKFDLLVKLIIYFFKNKFHIVHTNDGLLNFYFSIINIFFNYRLIIHLRNVDNSRRNYLPFFIAKKIICISRFVKKKTPYLFNPKKIVLYNYVDFFIEKIIFKKKHKYLINKNKNKKIILFVSNIHKRKKPKNFIKIIKKLEEIDKNYVGLMFFQSEKNDYKSLKNYISKNNINKNIYLFPNLVPHYWIPFIKKFKKKILLSTSYNEPLGRNLIEATLNEILVVANNSGGHKEIIQKGSGILCNTDNINDVANRINKLKEKNWIEINKISKINIQNKFQDKNFSKKIEKIYSKI